MFDGFRKKMEGYPYWQMSIICMVRFSEPLMFTSLFPYLYFMIRDFGIAKDETEISKYSGYLVSVFALMSFFFSLQWSRVADIYGRKPVLMCGLIVSSILMTIFGFSKTFYTAFIARGLLGALNGNTAVLRTVVGEVATEKRHQAIAFATIPVFWNIGSIIGPLIGGSKFFTRTDSKAHIKSSFNDWHEKFLQKYPYALSNIFVATLLLLGSVFAFLFLEETLPERRNRRDVGLEIGDFIRKSVGYKVESRPWKRESNEELINKSAEDEIESTSTAVDPLVSSRDMYDAIDDDDHSSSDSEVDSTRVLTRRTSDALIRRYSSNVSLNEGLSKSPSRFGLDREIFTNEVLNTFISGFLLCFHGIIYSEFLPVFLASEKMPEKLNFPFRVEGGLGWDSSKIGKLLSIGGVTGIIGGMVLFPIMDMHLNLVTAYRISCFIFPPCYLLIGFLVFTTKDYNDSLPGSLTIIVLIINTCAIALAVGTAFPQSIVMIHRAAPPKHRAFINGAALSSNALARFIAPLIWGNLMSFCNKKGWGHLSWVLLSLLSVVGVIQTFSMKNYD